MKAVFLNIMAFLRSAFGCSLKSGDNLYYIQYASCDKKERAPQISAYGYIYITLKICALHIFCVAHALRILPISVFISFYYVTNVARPSFCLAITLKICAVHIFCATRRVSVKSYNT